MKYHPVFGIMRLFDFPGVRRVRCSCKECGTYMVQAESDHLGCVCPDCGYRCADCLGTDTVVSRDRLKDLARDPRFSPEGLAASFKEGAPDGWDDEER